MSRRTRASFGIAAALAAFALLAGCGQRGPLTLPESARPIQRLDPGAATQSPPPARAPGAGAPTEPPSDGTLGAAPRPQDDERNKKK
jgi:predicted small lipoprotein YifL